MPYSKDTLVSFEVLEPKLPLTGSPGIARGDITATEVVMINKDVVGPLPIIFEKADFFNNNIPSFIVGHVAHGVVEKYDEATDSWKNISAVPATSNPRELIRIMKLRLIEADDEIRWRTESFDDMRESFTVIGWNNGEEVVEEAPNYQGANKEEWPNYVPDQELGLESSIILLWN